MASKLMIFGDVPMKNEWRNRFMSANERASLGVSIDVVYNGDDKYVLRVATCEEDVQKLRGMRFDDAIFIYPQLAKVPYAVIEAVQTYLVK